VDIADFIDEVFFVEEQGGDVKVVAYSPYLFDAVDLDAIGFVNAETR